VDLESCFGVVSGGFGGFVFDGGEFEEVDIFDDEFHGGGERGMNQF
jgi:hypothetical protein